MIFFHSKHGIALRTIVVATVCLVVRVAFAQSPLVGPPMPEEPVPSVRMDPVAVPKNDDEIRKLREKIREDIKLHQREIAKLNEKTNEREPGDSDPALAAALTALTDTLGVYETQLNEYADILLQIHGLEDSTASTQLTDDLTAVQKSIESVQNDTGRRPDGVTAEELRQAETDLETVRANLAARGKTQEERAQRRTDLPARLETLKAEAEAAQSILNRTAAELEEKKAKLPAESSEVRAVDFSVEKLKHDVGLVLLRMARIEQEVKRDMLLSNQAEQRLPLLRQLVVEHEKRVERYKQLRVRSEIQMAKEELERAKTQPQEVSPYELAYLDLQVRVRERAQELDEMQRVLGTNDRYTEDELAALKQDIDADVAQWSPYMEILDRKSGDKIKGYFKRLEKQEKDRAAGRDQILSVYDNALDDRVRITDRIDQIVDEELHDAWRNIQELERAEGNSETVIKLAPLKKELREKFENELEEIRNNLDALIKRLEEASKLLASHVDYLAAQRSRMYWSYLRVQDQPLWKYRWSETRAEWNADAAKRAVVIDKLQK